MAFKIILSQLTRARAIDIFSEGFIAENNVEQHEEMAIIDGRLIEPLLLGYKGFVPSCKDFIFYQVMNIEIKKPYHKLIECKFRAHGDE